MLLFLSSHAWVSPRTAVVNNRRPRGSSLVRMDSIDPDVMCVDRGLHFNHRFAAPNIWEVDVDEDLIDEAARIFMDGSPFESVTGDGEPYETINTSVGPFFLQRINWKSDACWISVDDRASYDAFLSIFTRLRLSERFATLFPPPASVRLYSAFYVVRSQCAAHNFHVDYKPEAGVDALTLITPLRNYEETDSFQLSYVAHEGSRCALSYMPPPMQLEEREQREQRHRHSSSQPFNKPVATACASALVAGYETMGCLTWGIQGVRCGDIPTRRGRRSCLAPSSCTALSRELAGMESRTPTSA